MTTSNMENIKYIYHLPFIERMELCRILNQNDKWEELAGTWMKYDVLTIQNLRREKNPTDELLTLWGHYNHTIPELFILLSRMQHYQSMVPLLNFVEPKFHRLLHNGEGNLQNLMCKQPKNKNTKDLKIGAQNFNQPEAKTIPKDAIGKEAKKEHHNILNEPMAKLKVSSSDSDNMLIISPIPIGDNARKINELSISKTESTLPIVTYAELNAATNGWNEINMLGKGGFGTVYKGIWKNTDVAIKKISRKGPDSDESYMMQLQQSIREIKILNSRAHENILPLYAYSFDGEAPCLIYQLMANGSLEDKLLLRRKTKPLSWLQRHEIAKGVARGLQYLHTIGDKPLIHGDIKSANILLDKTFAPRIGDFGLAREGRENNSMEVSKIHGTRPYLPDDYLYSRRLCTKVDTYSYGIVLFELATGLPAYSDSRPEKKFLREFIDAWGDEELPPLIDTKAGENGKQVYGNFIILGRWCTNRLAQNRPEMELVYRKLNEL